jgi:peptide/nickel transport system permease protein
MLAAFLRRGFEFILTLLLAAAAIFVLLHLLPGDPAAVMLGLNAPQEMVLTLRHELGLDQPALTRFTTWIASLLHGDLGLALTYRVPVLDLFLERLTVTLPLALLSLMLTLVFGLSLGCYSALRAYRTGDLALRVFSQLALSVPNFWVGLLLILIFSVQLRWFPAGGYSGIKSLILPALSLSLAQCAVLLRITRAALLDVLSEPYMRTARAKGLSRARSLVKHALPNTFLPVLTLLGLQLTFLLTGVIVVENVFALPGVGRLLFQAVNQHDLPLVQNLLLIFVAVILAVNFLVDLLALCLDPRLREASA